MKLEVEGKVVHGRKAGRKVGYPTANIDGRATRGAAGKFRAGVYAGSVKRLKSRKSYYAAIVAQPRPRRRHLQVEAYLINFKGNLYGEKLELEFKKFIRPWRSFNNQGEMINQIKKDLTAISRSNFIKHKGQ